MAKFKPLEVLLYGGTVDPQTTGGEDESVALAGNGSTDVAVHGEGKFATEETGAGSDHPATGRFMEMVNGMIFDSENDAITFCQGYAREKGFTIRRTSRTVEDKLQYFTLTCNREGKAPCRSKSSARTRCPAKWNFKLHGFSKFCLTSFILEHNHDLSPSETGVNACQNDDQQFGENECIDNSKEEMVVYRGTANPQTSGGEDEFVALPSNGSIDAAQEDKVDLPIAEAKGEFINEEIGAGSDDLATGKYMEPVKGMIFGSENDAIAFSQRYAREKGFAITRRTSKTADDKLQYFTLACNRQGKAQCRSSSRNKLKKNPLTKIQCPAKLNFKLHAPDKFCLISFIPKHNHDLSPSETSVNVCHNKMPTVSAKRRPESSGRLEDCANKMSIFTHAQGGGSGDQQETTSSEDQQFGENERTDNSKEEMVVYRGNADPQTQTSGGEDESVSLPGNGSTDAAQEDYADLPAVDAEAEFVNKEIGAGSDGPSIGKYMEPLKGMIFDSENDAIAFSQRYAREKGFAIAWTTSKTADEKLQYFTLACNRQGKAQCWSSFRNKLKQNASTETQCPAKLNFELHAPDKFCLSSFILEHNHDLSPSETRVNVCQNKTPAKRRRPESSGRLEVCANKMFILTHEQGGRSENQQFCENECTYNSKEETMLKFSTEDTHEQGGGSENQQFGENQYTDNSKEEIMLKFSAEDTHEQVGGSETQQFGEFTDNSEEERTLKFSAEDTHEQVGGSENQQLGENECTDNSKEETMLKFSAEDTHLLHRYFFHMQSKNPNFFYAMYFDENYRLRNVFWADARSRAAYESFSDVVKFDTAYLINKYKVPLASFVGVNHHGEPILLGCGLLSNQNTESSVWLFKSWLACMSNKPPKGMITDQHDEMQDAVEQVFPETYHIWCPLSVMKKIPEKLRGLSNLGEIKFTFSNVIYESLTKDELGKCWLEMISKFGLQGNDWLIQLCNNWKKWAPAYIKDTFWAGMPVTKECESEYALFDGYIISRTTINQFLDQYSKALRDMVEKEKDADFKSSQEVASCITHYDIEKQFQLVYTKKKFEEFQEQLKGKMYCYPKLLKQEGTSYTFNVAQDVKIREQQLTLDFSVWFNGDGCDMKCACRHFEFRGILCCHIISVLTLMKKEVPSKYVLQRWRKDLEHRHTSIACSYDDNVNTPNAQRFDVLCKSFYAAAEKAATSDALFELVVDGLGQLKAKVETQHAILNNLQSGNASSERQDMEI